MVRLTSLKVTKLLGRFDHDVAFPIDWNFVIIHGPNGVGKTKLLELVSAISAGRLLKLFSIPFDSITLDFSDATQLKIVRVAQMEIDTIGEGEKPDSLHITLVGPSINSDFIVNPADIRPGERRARTLERDLPIERVDRDTWFDRQHGDIVSLQEISRRYPERAPPVTPGVSDEFSEFIQGFQVHLIETQRLLTFGPGRPGERGQVRESTAKKYAEDLTRRIREALAENSRTSQQLDRTFPKRVLEAKIPKDVTDEQIRVRYEKQSELRDSLSEIAVLDTYASLPLPERRLQPWEQRVLWTYLQDTDAKLATFSQLLERVGLLRRIVNEKFLFNEIHIDREAGFRFTTPSGDQVGPDALSSGEQHELVLIYDLLFNVAATTTVLIDEPEISLHISWQQRFLDDITEISQVAGLRFIVATHSPQIINKWTDRMVPLIELASDDPGLAS